MRKYQDSIKSYKKAIKLGPNMQIAYMNMEEVQTELEMYK
jgi:hypothetical protein